MKHYKDEKGQVYAYEADGSQDEFIPKGLIPISDNEADVLRAPPVPTGEQLHDLAKRERDQAVSNIVVTTQSGKTFDGDETSQTRMSRSINGLNDGEVMPWKLADNTVASVDKAELREALRLAGAAQSALWFIP